MLNPYFYFENRCIKLQAVLKAVIVRVVNRSQWKSCLHWTDVFCVNVHCVYILFILLSGFIVAYYWLCFFFFRFSSLLDLFCLFLNWQSKGFINISAKTFIAWFGFSFHVVWTSHHQCRNGEHQTYDFYSNSAPSEEVSAFSRNTTI